jgi:flagellar basal body-associated protein FliL
MARVVILILVVLLAGGGAGAWWFGIRGEPLPFTEADAEEGESSARGLLDTTEFVELAPISFPVMQEGQVHRLMTVVVSLEVRGAGAQSAVADVRPRLRDALLSELHALYALEFVRERDDGLAFVKKRLTGAARRILGNRLEALYVQSVGHRETSAAS